VTESVGARIEFAMNQDEPSLARTPPADGERGAATRSGVASRPVAPGALRVFVERHTPKLVVCLREGYDARMFAGDVVAGLTVAVVAFPLAMALGIADMKDPSAFRTSNVPPGVEVFEINGPFFFGVADRLKDSLGQFQRPPKGLILRMRAVPHIDATGMHALEEFRLKCLRQGVRLLLGGVHAQSMFAFVKTGFDRRIGAENIFETIEDALAKAKDIIAPAGVPPQPATSTPGA
jgi:MFS superfamily sulfate permease-like transporter